MARKLKKCYGCGNSIKPREGKYILLRRKGYKPSKERIHNRISCRELAEKEYDKLLDKMDRTYLSKRYINK